MSDCMLHPDVGETILIEGVLHVCRAIVDCPDCIGSSDGRVHLDVEMIDVRTSEEMELNNG